MKTMNAINGIREIAADIHEKFGCPPDQRLIHSTAYTYWPVFCNALNEKLAAQLLSDVVIDDDNEIYYRVALQTIIDILKIEKPKDNSTVENIFEALDHEVYEIFEATQEALDPYCQQFVGNMGISQDCLRGTKEQWEKYLLDMPWYGEYLDSEDDDEPMSRKEWLADQIDRNTDAWDGDLNFEPMEDES